MNLLTSCGHYFHLRCLISWAQKLIIVRIAGRVQQQRHRVNCGGKELELNFGEVGRVMGGVVCGSCAGFRG